jgi:hypothetical protein
MSKIVVTIVDGKGGSRDLELPGDVPVSRLAPVIAEAIHHPNCPQDDTPFKAILKLRDTHEVVPLDMSLHSAGIAHGDILELMVKVIPSGLLNSDMNLTFTGPGFAHPGGSTYPFRGDTILIGRVDRASGVVSQVLGVDLTGLESAEEPSISRRHAQVLLREGKYLLQDLKSTNGTIVNGRLLDQEIRYPLDHGDEIQFGDVALFFIWDSQEIEEASNEGNFKTGDLE